ncbi:MAG: c-type cytochrome [Lysobacterales bacterium]|nr:c-type cytochrome [Xanthomonadales bacterium]MCB1611337.1 c-type cytochrome [Xanthomonadales bacterium]MCP5474812.1 c-type cytochrome [Rhodanobacteraceae bacterium]
MKSRITLTLIGSLCFALAGVNSAHAVDAKAAEALMKSNRCSSCHHPTKTKTGPSLKKMAEDFKGKPDAEELIIKAITTGPMVEIDGEKEAHKKIKTSDPAQLSNLAQWLLTH